MLLPLNADGCMFRVSRSAKTTHTEAMEGEVQPFNDKTEAPLPACGSRGICDQAYATVADLDRNIAAAADAAP